MLAAPTEERTTCQVCCEAFNHSIRKLAECPECKYKACRTCVRRYLTDITQDPQCMNCQCPWTDVEQLQEVAGRAFCNGPLRKKREEVLFERQKALLPSTQDKCETVLRERKIRVEIKGMQAQITRLQNEVYQKRRHLWSLTHSAQHKRKERREFIRGCPKMDCRGFLTTRYRCPLCESRVCSKCHADITECGEDEHECREEDVLSARLVMSSSKPCPECGTRIQKVSGCDAIFCVVCSSFWNWRTGRITSGVMHNPEYFRWLRERGISAEEDRQARRRRGRQFRGSFPMPRRRESCRTYTAIWRLLAHVRDVELRRYSVNEIEQNQDLRVRFLLGELTEVQMRKALQKREKANRKKQAIHNVFTTFADAIHELLQGYVSRNRISKTALTKDAVSMVTFSNEGFARIRRCFNSKAPHLECWAVRG